MTDLIISQPGYCQRYLKDCFMSRLNNFPKKTLLLKLDGFRKVRKTTCSFKLIKNEKIAKIILAYAKFSEKLTYLSP